MIDIDLPSSVPNAILLVRDHRASARRRIERLGRELTFEIRAMSGRPSAGAAMASAEEAVRLAVQAAGE